MKRRILITGTSGRIGGAIAARLRAAHEVIGLDRRRGPETQVIGDMCDRRLLASALDDVDVVVHVAALHAPHVGVLPDIDFVRINMGGTTELARAAMDAGVRHLVFTSTTALYGAACDLPDQAAWITETTTPEPQTIYHHTKLEAELLLEQLAGTGALKVSILRMSRCFPEPAPLMAVYRLHRGIDARDVAEAHELAIAKEPATFRRAIVSGHTPFDRSMVFALKRHPESVIADVAPDLVAEFRSRGWPLPTSIDRAYDATLAFEELGWRSRFGWSDVISQFDAGSPEVAR